MNDYELTNEIARQIFVQTIAGRMASGQAPTSEEAVETAKAAYSMAREFVSVKPEIPPGAFSAVTA